MRSVKTPLSFSQDLSSGALSYTTTFTKPFKLLAITLHASIAITETITVTLDSNKGSNYDTVLRSISLSAETDYMYQPDSELVLHAGDKIKVQCTNANLTGIVYGEIKSSEI